MPKPQLANYGYRHLEAGRLCFSDLTESRIYRLETDRSVEVWREHTNGTNGLYLLRAVGYFCAEVPVIIRMSGVD